jgi:predicted amidophosphoribosyltransferase
MSDIIETIRQGAGDLLSGIDSSGQLRSALEGIRGQWTELERRRKTSSLESEVKRQQAEMKQLTEALGLQTLSLYDTGKIANPELARLCQRINELRAEVEAGKSQLEQIQAEARALALAQAQAKAQALTQSGALIKCPLCQADLPANAEFCPSCGGQVKASAPASPAVQTVQQVTQTSSVVRLRCPQCQTILPADAEFCSTCGVKFRKPQQGPARTPQVQSAPTAAGTATPARTPAGAGTAFCPSCGAEASPNARFCPICGQTMSPSSA